MKLYELKINGRKFELTEKAKNTYIQQVQRMALHPTNDVAIKEALMSVETIYQIPERPDQ